MQFIVDNTGISLVNNQQDPMQVKEFSGELDVALKALSNFLKEHKLHRLKHELILTPDYYRLLFMDTPQLPPEECKLAARWLIKDFIDYPPEQAAIDVFPITVKSDRPPKMYIVVTPLAELNHIDSRIKKAKILLETITIAELGFATHMTPEPSVQVLLYPISQHLRLLIIEKYEVRWLRDLDFDWKASRLTASELEHFSFELQRSLDYYQTEISTLAPLQLKVAPELYAQQQHITPLTSLPVAPIIAEAKSSSLRQLLAYYLATQPGNSHATD